MSMRLVILIFSRNAWMFKHNFRPLTLKNTRKTKAPCRLKTPLCALHQFALVAGPEQHEMKASPLGLSLLTKGGHCDWVGGCAVMRIFIRVVSDRESIYFKSLRMQSIYRIYTAKPGA